MKLLTHSLDNKLNVLIYYKCHSELDGEINRSLMYQFRGSKYEVLRTQSYYTTNRQLTIQPL